MILLEHSKSLSLSETFMTSLFEIPDGERVRTCIQCGLCCGICPFGMWMDFPPRRLIASMRAGTFEEVLDSDTLWMCVSCYACSEICPADIPLTPGLMTRAKEELLLAGNIPTELQTALEYSQRYSNPLGESPRKRADWTKGLDLPVPILRIEKRPVEVLWFVGDYASYHPRVQQSTRALARIFHTLGVDFGILGPEEHSDGDSQRLAGERGLFEMLASKNSRSLRKYEFDQIVTTDPHAYNAIKNVYPELGLTYPIQHYTEFLVERLDQLQPLMTKEINALVTFHDPCYLGRANGIFEAPRELLNAVPGIILAEMAHNRSNSLCCGGGGGGMWLDGFHWEKAQSRLPEWRVIEALNASPDSPVSSAIIQETRKKPRRRSREEPAQIPDERILAVACPYELPRFEDATKVVREASKLVVKDIAEILDETIEE